MRHNPDNEKCPDNDPENFMSHHTLPCSCEKDGMALSFELESDEVEYILSCMSFTKDQGQQTTSIQIVLAKKPLMAFEQYKHLLDAED